MLAGMRTRGLHRGVGRIESRGTGGGGLERPRGVVALVVHQGGAFYGEAPNSVPLRSITTSGVITELPTAR